VAFRSRRARRSFGSLKIFVPFRPASLGAACAACLLLAAACAPAERAPKSLLLVTVDTLRPDYLGFHGYPLDTSPFLDAFFRDAVVFERAASPIGRTTPALASLLTGAYPHRTGVRRLSDPLSEEAVSLAEVLSDAGWQTFAVVTNQVLPPRRGLSRGFVLYDYAHDVRRADATTAAALRTLAETDPERPVFAWVHYIDPHVPYHPRPELARRFDPGYRGPYRLHFGWQPRTGDSGDGYRAYPADLPKPVATLANPLSPRENEHVRRLYAGDVRETDAALRRLVTAFRRRHEDAAVVVTADHGESLGEGGFYFDHGEYASEAELRVPLAIAPGGPDAGAGRCAARVSLVDLAPTLVELLGVPAPSAFEAQWEGRSLGPCLRGDPLPPAPLFAESGRSFHPDLVPERRRNTVAGRFRAVVLGDWKLVWTPFAPEDAAYALHDLARDPDESENHYRPDHPVVPELHAHLEDWLARATDDPDAPEPPLDPEDARLLRELGYLSEEGEAPEADAAAEP